MRSPILLLLCSTFISKASVVNNNEANALLFLSEYDDKMSKYANEGTKAAWNYTTNITDHNADISKAASGKRRIYSDEAQLAAAHLLEASTDLTADTRRKLEFVVSDSKTLTDEEEEEFSNIMAEMGKIYATAEVCLPAELDPNGGSGRCVTLTPELDNIMAKSKNYLLRTFIWKEWRRAVGRRIRPHYIRYVELKNLKARLNGHKDAGAQWRGVYEMDEYSFQQVVLKLYNQTLPLYKQLHAHVRRRLHDVYGRRVNPIGGKLPAHLLGDMWGRFWINLYPIVAPYPSQSGVDPTDQLVAQNYTVEKIFSTADDFFHDSMGLEKVPESFWSKSMLRKPKGRKVSCHATAWDFYDGKDYRIKMCGRDFSFEDLKIAFHELGHIQYYMQYSHLPIMYRTGANAGFHEAIGELMGLAAVIPGHLRTKVLVEEPETKENEERIELNFLMNQALATISTLPFHLVQDLWRWKIFAGEIPKERWNLEFWRMKEELVGVESPVRRSDDSGDLDPPTIFHVAQNYDMTRYFTRTILQFQFFSRLCDLSGHVGPLHKCDLSSPSSESGRNAAGAALKQLLRQGKSQPWQETLEEFAPGSSGFDAEPMMRFFEPLTKWLEQENQKNGDEPGWD